MTFPYQESLTKLCGTNEIQIVDKDARSVILSDIEKKYVAKLFYSVLNNYYSAQRLGITQGLKNIFVLNKNTPNTSSAEAKLAFFKNAMFNAICKEKNEIDKKAEGSSNTHKLAKKTFASIQQKIYEIIHFHINLTQSDDDLYFVKKSKEYGGLQNTVQVLENISDEIALCFCKSTIVESEIIALQEKAQNAIILYMNIYPYLVNRCGYMQWPKLPDSIVKWYVDIMIVRSDVSHDKKNMVYASDLLADELRNKKDTGSIFHLWIYANHVRQKLYTSPYKNKVYSGLTGQTPDTFSSNNSERNYQITDEAKTLRTQHSCYQFLALEIKTFVNAERSQVIPVDILNACNQFTTTFFTHINNRSDLTPIETAYQALIQTLEAVDNNDRESILVVMEIYTLLFQNGFTLKLPEENQQPSSGLKSK